MANWFSQLRGVPAEALQDAALTPQQLALLNAVDFSKSSGDAWGKIGKEGVVRYMQDSLRKRYGTDDISKIRYVADPGVDGGYRLDWEGRQQPTGFLSGVKDVSLSRGVTSGAPAGDASDGSPMIAGNPAEDINFGATWEGKGGTTFSFYRKPDGSVGIRTASAQSNDTGDILAGAAILAGGYLAGTGAFGGAAAGSAAEGAAAAGAAEGAAGIGAAAGDVGAMYAGVDAASAATLGGGASVGGAGGVINTFGVIDPAFTGFRSLGPGVVSNGGTTIFGVMDPGLSASMAAEATGGVGAAAGAGGGGGGSGGASAGGGASSSGTSMIDKLGNLTTGSKLGDMLLSGAASSALGRMLAPDAPDAPPVTASGRSPESITKAVSEMPDPIAQQRARRRSLTEQLGRRGRASTIMTKPSGRLGG